jgi:hypothetical protein
MLVGSYCPPEADGAVRAAEEREARSSRRAGGVQQRQLVHGLVPEVEPVAAQRRQRMAGHVPVGQELVPGQRVKVRGCADQLGAVRADPCGIDGAAVPVHVLARQDPDRPVGQPPIEVGQPCEMRSRLLCVLGAGVGHPAACAQSVGEEGRQMAAVLPDVVVQAAHMAP